MYADHSIKSHFVNIRKTPCISTHSICVCMRSIQFPNGFRNAYLRIIVLRGIINSLLIIRLYFSDKIYRCREYDHDFLMYKYTITAP